MSIQNEGGGTGMYMPVAPAYNYGNNNGFGGDWAWIIILLLAAGGGWGMGGFGGFGGMGGFANGAALYPWMNQVDVTTSGFQNAATNNAISTLQNGVTSGFGDVQNALCSGFASVNATINNAQMADLERSFATQTAITSGINGLSSQLANCCCENRLATNDLKYVIAQENCNDRQVISDGVKDILTAQNAGIQRILDQMCNDKIDAKNEKIADLERQLTMANLAASQTAQTSRILADNAAQTVALERYLSPAPIPSYTVPNPNGCGCNSGYGCNSGCGFNGFAA